VVGLGKLGACIAGCLASRGFDVVGIDTDFSKVDALRQRRAPVDEPGLQEMIEQASRLRATTDWKEAVTQSDAAFFVPATPSLPDGSFSNAFLLRALQTVGEEVARQEKPQYLFVVNSTVTPGSCDSVFKPLLERVLGGECGENFGVCYNPEFIALGAVLRGLLEPDFVLIGESDPYAGQRLEGVYRDLCINGCPVMRMSNLNAELAKISVNCFVTMKVSFVNQLAAVAARLPGADARVILDAIGNDHRIGADYLKPGLGYGGPCFPRDNRLFQYTAQMAGAEAALAAAADQINEQVNQRLLETVRAYAKLGETVAVLGLAYKPNTNVVECSPGIWLCEHLAQGGWPVLAHDFAAGENAARALSNGRIRVCSDSQQVFQENCRTFVVTCPWPHYRELFTRAQSQLNPGSVVIDPWGLLHGCFAQDQEVNHVSTLA
jgi:UDPglucose 6-dehydrogenase